MNPAEIASQGTQTILFTDLEGSTDIRVRLGDAVANEVFNEHDRLVRSQIEAGGGKDIKGLGDGFMALFTSANQAIETAVSIQRSIEERNAANPDKPIAVRIGINSGDVTYSEGDAHGTAVHAASRVAAKAQGDQILISQVVFDLAGSLGGIRVVDRGLFKGLPGPLASLRGAVAHQGGHRASHRTRGAGRLGTGLRPIFTAFDITDSGQET